METVNAVALCGGSLFGLAAADGVVRWLAEKGWGFFLEHGQVAPIVPAAALFDLGRGANYRPPVSAQCGGHRRTLTKAQAMKLAQMAQDGLARAIRPAHTMFDGDTIFCRGTGKRPLPPAEGFFSAPLAPSLNEAGRAMADCLSRAIVKGVLQARSLGAMTAAVDLPRRRE